MKYGLISMIICTLLASTAYAEMPQQEEPRIYIAVEVGKNSTELKSGGFNTVGAFPNTNKAKYHGNLSGFKIGADFMNKWRFDIGYRQYDSQFYTTDSFAPPTPVFFYASKVSTNTVMLTTYYDFMKLEIFEFYGGAGVGASNTEVATSDGVVSGAGSSINFALQAELGVDCLLTDNLVLNVGFRYIDLGETKINLYIPTGGAAGYFTADLASTEGFFGFRYIF